MNQSSVRAARARLPVATNRAGHAMAQSRKSLSLLGLLSLAVAVFAFGAQREQRFGLDPIMVGGAGAVLALLGFLGSGTRKGLPFLALLVSLGAIAFCLRERGRLPVESWISEL